MECEVIVEVGADFNSFHQPRSTDLDDPDSLVDGLRNGACDDLEGRAGGKAQLWCGRKRPPQAAATEDERKLVLAAIEELQVRVYTSNLSILSNIMICGFVFRIKYS